MSVVTFRSLRNAHKHPSPRGMLKHPLGQWTSWRTRREVAKKRREPPGQGQ